MHPFVKFTSIICALIFVIGTAQAVQASTNDIPPVLQRQMFVMGVVAGIINSQMEARQVDPTRTILPVEGGLAAKDDTIGVIKSQLCDDVNLQQTLARAFNSKTGKITLKKLGFTGFWCASPEHGWKVFPAQRQDPPTDQTEI